MPVAKMLSDRIDGRDGNGKHPLSHYVRIITDIVTPN